MDYEALGTQLKNGELQRVYLFYGPERYMLQIYEKRLVRRAIGDGDPAWNVSRFDEKADPYAVRDACEMLPVFCPVRVVRVENCAAFKKGEMSQVWADIVKNVPDTCLLLFVQKDKPDGRLALTKAIGSPRQVFFDALTEKDIHKMISESVSRRNLVFQKGALKQLIYQTGTDAATLAQETRKLEDYVYPKREITEKDVRAAAIRNEQADAFDITDDLIAQRWENAFERLSIYIRQGGIIAIMRGAVVFSLRQLLTARLLMDSDVAQRTILKRIRGPWLAREKTVAAARRVSVQWIQRALCAVAEGDEIHKSGQMDEQSAFELSLIRAFVDNKKSDAVTPDANCGL